VSPRIADQRGLVMLEFVIAFVRVFMLFLTAAQLVVAHAAVCGARSAAVVLDDDPRFYDGALRGEIDRPHKDGPRLAAIRAAVHAPLTAITPDQSLVRALLGGEARADDLARAVGDASNDRFLLAAESYVRLATAVVFPAEPNGNVLDHGVVILGDRISVRVSHLVPCSVPIVGPWMCEHLSWDRKHGRLTADAPSPEQARALQELASAPDAFRQVGFARAHVAVAVLHAEATMPLQHAEYRYRDEDTGAAP
jgi:hypothetical protein